MKPWEKRGGFYRTAAAQEPKIPHVTYGNQAIPSLWGVFQTQLSPLQMIQAVRLDLTRGLLALTLRMPGRDKLSYLPYQDTTGAPSYQWSVKCRRCAMDSRFVDLPNKKTTGCSKCGRPHMDVLIDNPFLRVLTRQKTYSEIYEEEFGFDPFTAYMVGSEVPELESLFRTYARLDSPPD